MALNRKLSSLTAEQLTKLAEEAGTTIAYLQQLKGGYRRPSPELSKHLEEAARKLGISLSRSDCRPDLWPHDLWPQPEESVA